MLLLAMDSEAQTELIYAQILQNELEARTGSGTVHVSRFNPLAVRRQPLLDFLRLQPYERIAIIGSAELHTLQFPVYHRPTGKWMLFDRKDLETLIHSEHTDPQ
jgi:hypothetical protein